MKKSILKGSLILTASNLIVRTAGYIYRILMGRMLSPYEFGLLNLALPLQYMSMVLASSGIAPGVAKFVSEYEAKGEIKKRDATIISSLIFYTLIGIAIGIGFYVSAGAISTYIFHNSNVAAPLKIASLAMPFGFLIAVYTGVFQGFKKIEYMGATLVAQQLLRISFAIILVSLSFKATNGIFGSTLGFIGGAFIAYVLFAKLNLNQKLSNFNFKDFKEVFTFSMPISVTAISAFLLAYIDAIILGFYLTPVEVGIYSAASPTSRLILAFFAALYAVLLPYIAELKAKNFAAEIKEHVKYAYKISLLVLIPITLLSIRFSNFIIAVLFGSSYAAAVSPFKILLIGTAFFGVYTLNSGIFQGIGKPKVPMKILLVTAVLDIILNLILVPEYQIEGAAIASTLSFIFAGIFSTITLKRMI